MQNTKGFTLIELIIVVVILGIMAIAAFPQFINFGSDAERSRIRSLAGTLKSSVGLVYSQANVKNLHQQPVTCLGGKLDSTAGTCPDGGVLLHFGYPAANENALKQVISLNDWVTSSITTGFASGIRIAATEKDITACYVQYEEATSNNAARVEVSVDGC